MQRQPNVTQHQFSQVPRAEIQRSSFDRSHGYKTTFNAGHLVPVFVDEALPGDTFNCRMSGFARLATPIFPIMDNMRMETFFFAVPIRLIWENWQRFNGEQTDPGDSTDFTPPYITSTDVTGWLPGSIHDYMGIPTQVPGIEHSSMWHRAYNLIWNEWFRDQNLQDSLPVPKGDGPDPTSVVYNMERRGKRHDYFTSCLPWPQKGDSVSIPLGQLAPVVGLGVETGTPFSDINSTIFETDKPLGTLYPNSRTTTGARLVYAGTTSSAGSGGTPKIYADLTDASAATINQLRQAFQVQKMLERDARGGTRYVEIIKAHFGVTSPDARLQRPEYLGGGSTPVNIQPVAQTTPQVGAGTPQGNLAAVGTATLSGHSFIKSFTEHCLIIGLINVRADLTYQRGLNRMFSREFRYDYYWPALAQIGEQAVLNREIYCQGSDDPVADKSVFGYQERYAEYRYKPSEITGLFRSIAPGTLDAWHLAQDFGSLPMLNDAFITDQPPIDRVIAVDSEPHFILDTYFNLRCARPMPLYGVPGLIDHF